MDVKHPLISVVMSVYNTEFRTVKRAIDSVFKQTYTNFELIVIDDGSDNETYQQLVSYCIMHQDKVTYLRHTNHGQSLSVNKGILVSKGAYITMLDGDDEYKKNHLKRCLEAISGYDLIASITETVVDSDSDYYVTDKNDKNKLIHIDECTLFATLFGKRAVFEAISFKTMYGADAHFFEIAQEQFQVKKVNLKTYIYYRNSGTSICSQKKVEAGE